VHDPPYNILPVGRYVRIKGVYFSLFIFFCECTSEALVGVLNPLYEICGAVELVGCVEISPFFWAYVRRQGTFPSLSVAGILMILRFRSLGATTHKT